MFSQRMKRTAIQGLSGSKPLKNGQVNRSFSTLLRSLQTSASFKRSLDKSVALDVSSTTLEMNKVFLQTEPIKFLSNPRRNFSVSSTATPAKDSNTSQNDQQESTQTNKPGSQKKRFGLKIIGLGFLTLFLVKCAQFFQEWYEYQKRVKLHVMPEIPAPKTEFQHPMNTSSWFYRQWFRIRRILYLIRVFIPVFFQYGVWFFRDTPDAREKFLSVLVKQLEAAGCSFLKFGQWLSMRPDMFPPDVIGALAKLRDNAPSHSIEETHEVFQQEMGASIDEMFDHFDPVPVASGSIAQVYRGTLKEEWARKANLRDSTGALVYEVAVKVRHPKVLDETWMDVDLIFGFANNSKNLTVPFSRDEFLNLMQKQVDFRWEGHYLSRFGQNFKDEIAEGHVRFPVVSDELLATGILIESWAPGRSVDSIFTHVGTGFKASAAELAAAEAVERRQAEIIAEADRGPSKFDELWSAVSMQVEVFENKIRDLIAIPHKNVGVRLREGEEMYDPEKYKDVDRNADSELFDYALMLKKKQIAFTMFDMFLKMFLRDNLIHGDLHAGNVLYNQSNNACTVLDAGMTVSMDDNIIPEFGKFLFAICSGNPKSLVDRITIFEMNLPEFGPGSGNGHLANNPKIREAFARDVNNVTERFFENSKYSGLDLMHASRPKNVSIGDVVGQVLFAMQRHGIVLRGDVAASIMAMSVVEGLIRQLDPTLDIIFKALPYFVKYRGFTSISTVGIE